MLNRLAILLSPSLVLFVAAAACGEDGNRLAYLDAPLDPYYVSRQFPKLTTPQWIDKQGVEAVVVLAIDDMRDTAKYEAYLRPILERLKKIDGRAPLSIMTNRVDPAHPQLQKWRDEGVSIEVHTYDHPCPCLQKGDFKFAQTTYERCVDLMAKIPNNQPVAFRMPCCDSLNTPSPRFFAEIFNRRTPEGNFLAIDSSVFQVFTAADPDLPAELTLDPEGRPRFRKYIPFPSFVNTIENYPYPYIIGNKCWQFPCMVPSDWEAQHIQQPNNPLTVRDMKAALDATVIKQGVFNLVFHPHGWMRNDQVIELIDHAQEKHGDKVLFLSFREALEQINSRLLDGHAIRDHNGDDNGVRLLDLNSDGYLDVVSANEKHQQTRIWDPAKKLWRNAAFPSAVTALGPSGRRVDQGVRFGVVQGRPAAIVSNRRATNGWSWNSGAWVESKPLTQGLQGVATVVDGIDQGVRLRDADHDGTCELIAANPNRQMILKFDGKQWSKSGLQWPESVPIVDAKGRDAGLRFVDVDGNGFEDVLFSDDQRYSLHLWNGIKHREPGWSIAARGGKRGDEAAIPMVVRAGTNNGAWFHSGTMWVQNEDTHRLPNLVDRRKLEELLPESVRRFPPAKTPDQSRKSIRVPAGLQIELAAAEPLVNDPIAIDWAADGALFVAEMGDYPNGVDETGGSGGRIKRLMDDDNDGRYDRATLFLDKLAFPTGVKAWRKGVLITAAPDILYAEDQDNDGKADIVKKVFSGFGTGNQQHRVNGLRWGLDNWLYLANGDSGGEIRHVDSKKPVNIRGRDLRIQPDRKRLDAVAGQTQFGRNRDDWGNWFGGNNSNPMWQYVLDDETTRRNPHVAYGNLRPNVFEVPGTAPVYPLSRTLDRFNDFNKTNRFTSACSPIVYRDRQLGDDYADNVFVCEPVHNLVHREVALMRNGVMVSRRSEEEQNSEFLASRDNWFRPTMVRTGPDGALWVVDMYRFVIEHPEWIPKQWQQQLTLRAGNDRGRIYRVTPVDRKLPMPPPLEKMSSTELVKELANRNGTRRDMAHQVLLWRDDRAVAPDLVKIVKTSDEPRVRLQAICALAALESLRTEDLITALADQHPGVRRWAVYWAARHAERDELLPRLLRLAADENLRVRMEVAIALGRFDQPSAASALAAMAISASDNHFLRAAVLSSVNTDNLETVATVVSQAAEGERAPPMLAPLLSMAAATKTDDAWRTPIQKSLRPGSRAPDWSLSASAAIALRLNVRGKRAWADPETVRLYNQLLDQARRDVVEPQRTITRRALCLQLIGAVPIEREANRKTLAGMLNPQTPIELQRAAVRALGQVLDPAASRDTPTMLVSAWGAATPALRDEILDVLLSRGDWSQQLLSMLEKKQLNIAILGPRRRQQLLNHRIATIKASAQKLLGTPSAPARAELVDRYVAACSDDAKGNAQRGRQTFEKKCGNCHRLDGVGHAIGPDLAALTNKSPRALLTALLVPNAQVEDKYLDYAVVLNDGRQVHGMLTGETATALRLTGPEAKTIEVLRKDVDVLQSTGKSMMPEGLEKEVAIADAVDLIAFLRSASPPSKPFPGNQPQLVTPRDDGSIHLFSTHCKIYGPSVVMEEKYRNLGFWASSQDRAVWTVDVPRAGTYLVTIDYACDDAVQGNRYVVVAGDQTVGGVVAGTGSWDRYRRAAAGRIELPQGSVELTFRSDGPVENFLLDLRAVVLKPIASP